MNTNNIFHKNLPNILTIARILSIPIIIYFLIGDNKIISFFLVLFFSLTDFLDGYYARTFNLVTGLGRYLDPLADKVFILSLLLSLHYYFFNEYLPLWMIIIVFIRDISVTFLRNIYNNNNNEFKTSTLGKRKTLIQIICIHIMLLVIILKEYNVYHIDFLFVYLLMLGCSALTLYSGLDYFYKYFKLKTNVND